MLSEQDILKKFAEVSVWRRGDRRAPHKPLLLLYVLARCSRGEGGEVSYLEAEEGLGPLLREFGPAHSPRVEMPFWYLRNDGVWFVAATERIGRRKNRTDPKRSELRKHNPVGGLLPEICDTLRHDRSLLMRVVAQLLHRNFPESLHEDILAAVGWDLRDLETPQARRDADFRAKVLRAYGHRCAVCGYDLRLGAADLALEAAHIKWHQAGGPDIESNGLALCSLHHKMFDRGAFSISSDLRVLVSQDVCGSSRLDESLLIFHGQGICTPQSPDYYPREEYLHWHREEVFRSPARHPA